MSTAETIRLAVAEVQRLREESLALPVLQRDVRSPVPLHVIEGVGYGAANAALGREAVQVVKVIPRTTRSVDGRRVAVREPVGLKIGADRDDPGGEFGVFARFEQGAEVAPAPGDEDDEPEHPPSLPI